MLIIVSLNTGNKYLIKIRMENSAPKILLFLDNLSIFSSSIILSIICFLVEKIMGKSASEYKKAVAIYKKGNSFFVKKSLIYEEQIPNNLEEGEIRKVISALEDALNKNNLEVTLFKEEKKNFLICKQYHNLTSWTNSDGITTTYSDDAVGNLTQKSNRNFTYNAANEITNSRFTYEPLLQQLLDHLHGQLLALD